jgi:hypothetical protein
MPRAQWLGTSGSCWFVNPMAAGDRAQVLPDSLF